jgi:hypothetical protein
MLQDGIEHSVTRQDSTFFHRPRMPVIGFLPSPVGSKESSPSSWMEMLSLHQGFLGHLWIGNLD